ncbi:MAG: prolipoprotein diacylglyceryl transferase [Oscillospiraceae bacterium]|nr:prolipoprotein diacylglyceryl transferase [Oscillospiraceae bacterium]
MLLAVFNRRESGLAKDRFLFTLKLMYPYLEIFNRHIPSYGICLLLGIIFVFLLCTKSAKNYGCNYYDLLIIGAFALLFALPSGSLLYTIVTYNYKEIISFILKGNFSIFGGLVFYGALIGGIIGGILGIGVAKLDLCAAERIIIPYIPIGHAVGRVGCLLAGCCYGMECTGPIAVYYQHSVAGALPHQGYFPIQILEALLNICICFILLKVRKKAKQKYELLSVYFMLYGLIRFFLEFLRGDVIRGIYYNISTSQWISLALFVFSSSYIIYLKIMKKTSRDLT